MTVDQYNEIRPMLERVVTAILRDRRREDMIDDAIQDAWEKVLKILPGYDPSRGNLLTTFLYPYIRFTAMRASRDTRGGFGISDRQWNSVRRGTLEPPEYVPLVFTPQEQKARAGGPDNPEPAVDPPGLYAAEVDTLLDRCSVSEDAMRRVWMVASGYKHYEVAAREGVSRQAIFQTWNSTIAKLREAV